MYEALITSCSGCVVIISTNLLVIQKFIIHLPTIIVGILEIIVVLSIVSVLILAIIFKRRDLLNIYMIAEFVHSQYRVIVAVTAVLVGVFPQTYLFALSSRQYTRSQVQTIWILVACASCFAWTLQMASVYFALRYRSYLPRFRRRKGMSEAVLKKKLIGSTTVSNISNLELRSVPEKMQQPVPETGSQPLPENNQQLVSAPSAISKTYSGTKGKH
ncbi:unnamed protein product [Onchocerca ochengi]|uniref:G_PROTEIN_RECEP_F1_2 domain-containing protein n=1 Tax=Onchocerca ochengi TaxID=42157 RepID=A0A182EJN8_ONCOC|nr:unnamed protein product [Onchocerca ochengi]